MKDIVISGAREGNLKSISLRIPREKLVVLTGVSGSGKSTLLIDVLFNECQRQYLETMDLQGIRKSQVENIRGVSPAVCITPVSYTHLSCWARLPISMGIANSRMRFQGAPRVISCAEKSCCSLAAVSYTHLPDGISGHWRAAAV